MVLKRYIMLMSMSLLLAACSTNTDTKEPSENVEEQKENIEEKDVDKDMTKTRYIVSFNRDVTLEDLKEYGVEESDVINEMDNMNMKTIDLDESQYESLKEAPFVTHIEADEEIGISPGEKEDKSDEM